MRPVSSLTVKWMSVLTVLAVFALANLASAQSGSKPKLTQSSLHAQPVAAARTAKPLKTGSLPPVTTETWTGGGGSNNNWSDAANWNNGAIASGDAILINLTTANTVDDQSYTISTLTLSHAGDSVTLNNNVQTTVTGNISNAGTITLDALGNVTELYLNNSLTLSGAGSLVLTSTNGNYTGELNGVAGSTLTNSSNITGGGNVGVANLNLTNSGTINANISGVGLTVQPDTCTGCTSMNTGTLEATNGGTLILYGGNWTQTSPGTISAANGSAVNLENNVSITGGTLTTTGTGTINGVSGYNVFLTNVTNSGSYILQNNNATEISGTLTNNGTITIDALGNNTQLYLAGNTTLSGTGTVVLTSTNNNYTGYVDGASGAILTNQTNITGWGTVGNGQLQVANASNGTINANISGGTITLNPDTLVTSTNAGLMEGTNGGTLLLYGGTWTNTGGTIEAQTGSAINLENNVSITGGTLKSVGTGSVNSISGYNVFLTGLTLAGTYNIQNNSATEISGTITNNGTINLQGLGNVTQLYVNPAASNSATLTGTGSIVLGSSNGNYTDVIDGNSTGSLTIDQLISGAGTIGNSHLTLTNNSTIDANLGPTVTSTALTIQPGSGGMTNTGTLEATNGGTLQLYGSTINNAGGTIQAVGSDGSGNPSVVLLDSGVSITGGTLTTSGAGVIEVPGGYQANLTTLTNSGTLNVVNNGQLNTNGTITNNGTINLQSIGNNTYLYAPTNTTLTGTGAVVMSSSNGNYATNIIQAASGVTITNAETIQGGGTIQDGTFVNNGTINANVSGAAITLQALAAGTNTKTMEASNGGTLAFNGSSWTNTGGTITAQTGSAVELYNGTSITGGTLTTAGTGQIFVPGGYQANLTTLTNSGTLNVQNNGELNTNGTITNNGTINLQSLGNNTYLYAPTNTTLTGTGAVVMSSSNGNYGTNIIQAASGVTITNAETIEGGGTIEDGTFINNGTINANVSGVGLTLQALTAGTNTKTMEASNGGTLIFNGSSWTQTGAGAITAQTGSAVELLSNASITGGILNSVGTGQFFTPGGYVSFLANLTNNGTFNVQNNAQTELTGTITNNGTFNVTGAGNNTYLLINGAVTLKGNGIVDLGSSNGNYTNFIYGQGTTPTLTSFNTIEGAGNLGSSNMGFTNDGTLLANIAGQNLAINVNSSGFTNYNGTTATLTGGNYIANGGNITFNAGNTVGIVTLAASVTEEAGGQIINTDNSSNALANLTSITSAGSFTTDVNFTDAGAFSNAGSLTILGATTFKVASLTQISGGSLTAGTYVLDSNLDITGAAQTITTNAATLTLAGGTIENTSNSTNALAGLATNSGKLTIGGSGNNLSTTASSFSNTGTLTINSSDSFTAGNLSQISGTTLSGGTFVLNGNLDLTTTGISITTNSSTLTLGGGTINSGSSNALAGLASNTKALTLDNNANFTTAGNFSDTGTLTVDSGSTFTVSGTLSQMHTATNTLQGGTYVVGGTFALAAGTNGIETDSASITLDGTGTFKNTTAGSNANALVNLNTISSTGSFTLGSNANFTTAGNFTNSGKLTVNTGSTFSVAGTLSNLSSGILSGGTFTVGGTLQLTSGNGGITANGANLTLSGTTAKILDGSSNALSGLSSNNGGLTLTGGATLSTAGSLTNTGSVNVAKGSTLTVSGTGTTYTQAVNTGAIVTTIDGTLAGISGGAIIQDGTIQGAGTIKGNLTAGNGSGAAVTVNVGDAGKAGLLSITGKYTQLSTGTLNVSVGGTTVGTQYSQLKITGTASLGGTLTAGLINAFTPTVGQTFTVLTATGGLGGTQFSNTTIAINATEHFSISYTSTSVILTVVSGPASAGGSSAQPAAQMVASAKPAANVLKPVSSRFTHRIGGGVAKPVLLAGLKTGERGEPIARPIWERIPAESGLARMLPVTVAKIPSAVNVRGTGSDLAGSYLAKRINPSTGTNHEVPVRAPLAGWTAAGNAHRVPLRILPPALPRVR